MGSDSALYMSLGRNLAEGAGYTHEGTLNRLIFPGLPWLLSGIMGVTGSQSHIWPTLIMLSLGFIALALTYRLFTLHIDRATAVCVTCLTGMAYTFYQYPFEILSDMPFCVGVLAVLAGYEGLVQRHESPARSRLCLTSDGLILAVGLLMVVVTRPTMWVMSTALLVTSLWCLAVGRDRLIHVAIVVVMSVCVVGFWLFDPRRSVGSPGAGDLPGYERWALAQLNHLDMLCHTILTQHLPKFFEPHFAEAVFGMELGPGLNTIAGVVILMLGIHLGRYRLLWGVWFGLMVLTMLIAEPAVRYTVPLIPLIAFAWWQAIIQLARRLSLPRANQVTLLLIALWCVPNVIRTVDFILDQRQTPFIESYKKGRYAPLLELGAQLKDKVEDDAIVIAECSHELSYLSRRHVEHTTTALIRNSRPTKHFKGWLEASRPIYLIAVDDDEAVRTAQALDVRVPQKMFTVSTSRVSASLYRIMDRP